MGGSLKGPSLDGNHNLLSRKPALDAPASQGSALKLHGTLVLLAPLLPPTSGHFLLSPATMPTLLTLSVIFCGAAWSLYLVLCVCFLIKLTENVFIL